METNTPAPINLVNGNGTAAIHKTTITFFNGKKMRVPACMSDRQLFNNTSWFYYQATTQEATCKRCANK